MNRQLLLLSGSGLAVVCLALLFSWFISQPPPVDFNAEIRPIINKKCISCHGGVKREGGFSLLFRQEALENTESGKPAIIPGKPDESEMIARLRHPDPEERMPLNADPLSDEEVEKLKRWIKQGAEWEDHWAYVAPAAVPVPPVRDETWVRNEIDYFILNRLEKDSLRPSAEADKATLLRRVSLDLTGLPPGPELVQSFMNDDSPEAYEKAVDSLLASPHYGERWASLWLDLARYADTKGYEKDEYRNGWRFRDYVIRSFNADKPFDQFTIEQLAGDLLPNPTDEQLLATAFHRMTSNNDEGGTDDEEFRTAAIIDRVNTTWEVWQATTMSCVQCHSHPYDPFRHEEYYQSMAFFNNTRDEDTPDESPALRFFEPEQEKSLERVKDWIRTHAPDEKEARVQRFVNLVKITEPKIHPHSCDSFVNGELSDGKYLAFDHNGRFRMKNVPLTGKTQLLIRYRGGEPGGTVEFRKGSPEGEVLATVLVKKEKVWGFKTYTTSVQATTGTHDIYAVLRNPAGKDRVCTIEWILFTEELPGREARGYQTIQDSLLALLNTSDRTPVLIENPEGFRRKTHIFDRGNWLVKGEEVQSDVPESMPALPETAPRNRLGLAQWLVSPENPLTARVAVNRFWEQFFGLGLVETAEDFGTQGAKPTHPELLDWLAVHFRDQLKWSPKQLHKLIVMSATYRQSSHVRPELLEKDPANYLLARGPRFRLPAEQVRDQALAVSGLLSNKMYGKSVMPPQPEGVWQVVYSGLQWKTSEGEDAYRRGLYTFWRRSVPYPSMVTFDAPMREICLSRRIRTNTPLQALVTLNDTVYVTAAQALATRMLLEGGDRPEDQVRHGYQLALLREPSPAKLQILTELYRQAEVHYRQNPESQAEFMGVSRQLNPDESLAPLSIVASAILNLDEFITKE